MTVWLALVSNISVSLLLMLPLFPVFTFASDLTLFFFLDSCFPLNGRPRNIRKELRKTGKHSCFERKLLYLVTLTVQAAVPGDSVNCYTWWFWQCRLLYLVILAVLTAIPGDSHSAGCYTWWFSQCRLLYLVILTVQAAIPGDSDSADCYTWWFWQCRLL